MNTREIFRLISSDLFVKRYPLVRVLARNQLPRYIDRTKPAVFVVNTDPSWRPGSHWVGLHYDGMGQFEYFDSFGLPPTVYRNIHRFITRNSDRPVGYNSRILQDVLSDYCGLYVIHFVLMKARGANMKDLLRIFPAETKQWRNDRIVYRLLRPKLLKFGAKFERLDDVSV